MMSMAQEKSSGNDGLAKELCKCFWEDLKDIFITSLRTTKRQKEFTSSQKEFIENLYLYLIYIFIYI